MPPCYCRAYNCNGKNLVQKTLNAHSHADLANNAQIAADKAIASQESDIISKFSRMSLTDKIALGVQPHVSSSSHPDSVDTSRTRELTRHQRIEKSLRAIQMLEAQFFALEFTPALSKLSSPSFQSDLFPFNDLVDQATHIKNELKTLTKVDSFQEVVAARVTVENKIEEVISELKDAQRLWVQLASKCPPRPSAPHTYDTGMHHLLTRYFFLANLY
jgi:hypothetical protein